MDIKIHTHTYIMVMNQTAQEIACILCNNYTPDAFDVFYAFICRFFQLCLWLFIFHRIMF
jgi:hypothetical protein